MAKDNKITMPSSGAGITRYFDEYKSNLEIKPGHVILIAFVIMIIVVLMHVYGGSWFGIQ